MAKIANYFESRCLLSSTRIFFLVLAAALLGITPLYAATEIKGKVVDEKQQPIAGVAVSVKSSAIGAITGGDGEFSLSTDQPLPVALTFNLLGYNSQEVEVYDAGALVLITLGSSSIYIDEVVVTALGISKARKSLGYATQEVKEKTLEANKESNLVNALAGRLAGVRTTNSQGDMGSSRIVIRGETSIAGNNQPLFIVDGVPVDNSQLYPSSTTGGNQSRDFRNAIADLSSEDIATISVLKGPNAAALYGSRAAHGVVLITTKSGKGHKGLGVSVSAGATFATVATLPEFQDVFGQGANGEFSYVDGKGGGLNDGYDESWGPRLDGRLIPQFHSNGVAVPWVAHPDNVKDFFETGVTQDYGVSVSNSDDKYNFRLGVNFQDQKGTVPNTEIKKTNFTLSADYQLTKRIKAGANVNYIITDAPNLPGGSYGQRAAGVMLQFLWFGRQVDMAELKKDWNRNWNDSYYSNPYWRAYYNTVEQNRNRLIGDVHLSVNLLEGLDFKFRSGTDYYNDRRKYKIKTGTNGVPDGSYTEDAYTVSENNTEAILSFTRNLTEDFSLDALGGVNVRSNTYANNYQKATKLAAPDLFTLSNSKDPLESSSYYSALRVYSLFASTQLGYKSYAFLNLTGRNDWSSTLPRNNRSYFYPSATASLVLSEIFGLQGSALNFIRLRGGWAEVGSDADPYQLATVYNIQTAFNGNPIQTSSKQKNNPDIRPEKTQSTELGVELGLLSNRALLDVALYNTNSIDQILKVQTSSASGYEYQLINAGKINNKGLEVQLNVVPVKVKDFSWNLGLNYATNLSEVVELDKDGLLEKYVIGTLGAQVVAAVGERYGALYGTAYKRDAAGNIIVGDDGKPKIDPNNKVLGHYTPDWTGGLTSSFTYKNVELSALIDASIGGSIYSGSAQTGYYAGVYKGTLPGRGAEFGGLTYTDASERLRDDGIIFEGVKENGAPNDVILSAEDYYHASYSINEAWIYDASYIKLREVKLGYTFEKNLIKRVGLEGLTLSLVARNLAFLYRKAHDIDPEAAFNTSNVQGVETLTLPTTRSFGFNINLKF
ncbi:MAG: SusC/RagA family TonB-linked outer membrane protein [Prevotellaceae bacterium]|jgi:TonB-linked SusC/RagA family outer membrane protein|nr:SusC/RagA family TonB-linked outer membrane protein [Prevotellaceae bacterium]